MQFLIVSPTPSIWLLITWPFSFSNMTMSFFVVVKYAQVIFLYWLLGMSLTRKSSFSAEIFSFTVFAMDRNDAHTAAVLWLVFSDKEPIQLGPSEVYTATVFHENLNKHSFPGNTEKDLHFKTNPCQGQLLCIQDCIDHIYIFLNFTELWHFLFTVLLPLLKRSILEAYFKYTSSVLHPIELQKKKHQWRK